MHEYGGPMWLLGGECEPKPMVQLNGEVSPLLLSPAAAGTAADPAAAWEGPAATNSGPESGSASNCRRYLQGTRLVLVPRCSSTSDPILPVNSKPPHYKPEVKRLN